MSTTARTYAEQLEALAEQYREETGAKSVNLNEVASWAYAKGLWKPYPQDVVKLLANQLSRALRSIHKTDEQGRVVRAHYAVPIRTDNQLSFEWFKPEQMDFAEMHASARYRRGLIRNDCRQAKTDIDSWNDNYSDGRKVRYDFNFNQDLLDDDAPDTHPDIDTDDDIL